MTDFQIVTWLTIMLVVGAIAIASMLAFAFTGDIKKLPKLLSTGLIILTVGLFVQIIRSMHYFEFGKYPVDYIFPMWVLKDLGGSLIIYYFVFFWKREIS